MKGYFGELLQLLPGFKNGQIIFFVYPGNFYIMAIIDSFKVHKKIGYALKGTGIVIGKENFYVGGIRRLGYIPVEPLKNRTIKKVYMFGQRSPFNLYDPVFIQ
jgi:hypothetical protein